MSQETASRVSDNPRFLHLVRTRNVYSGIMVLLVMVCYYGYILLIAFDRELLASKVGNGVTTLGIPLGIGVILFTVVLTWIYVRRANSEFDAEMESIVREAQR